MKSVVPDPDPLEATILLSLTKVFFGIPVVMFPFQSGVTFLILLIGLVGLNLILSGITGVLNVVIVLKRSLSESSRPQTST